MVRVAIVLVSFIFVFWVDFPIPELYAAFFSASLMTLAISFISFSKGLTSISARCIFNIVFQIS